MRSPFSLFFIYLSCLNFYTTSSSPCSSDKFVAYKVILSAYWDRKVFPKQYPEWRPPAQWSKVVGFSHNDDFVLFNEGSQASTSVKEFAETGSTEELDKVSDNLILDVFSAPPIPQGVGRTQGSIFLDGNHTKVSLMSKLVPSPDWFIGLDSYNLCKNGKFLNSVTIEAGPMDAGSDNGFTFTSPNWPTEPQAQIFKITNTYPSHPAGSFNYPELSNLPVIATFSFIKEKEYELSEMFHINEEEALTTDVTKEAIAETKKDEENKTLRVIDEKFAYTPADESVRMEDNVSVTFFEKEHSSTTTPPPKTKDPPSKGKKPDENEEGNDDEWNRILNNEILHNPKKIRHSRHRSNRGNKIKSFRNHRGGYLASIGPTDFLKKRYKSKFLSKAQEKIFDIAPEKRDKLYQRIFDSYKENKRSKLKKRKWRKLRRKYGSRSKRNCKVSEWGEWGKCSKTCGIGESIRTRSIEIHPKRGGKPCPDLRAVKWCGSARNCAGKYFDW